MPGDRRGDSAGRSPSGPWHAVLDGAMTTLGPDLANEAFLAAVVLPHRITSADDYLTVRRPGHGVALDRVRRSAVWKLFEDDHAQNRIDGTVCRASVSAACSTRTAGGRFANSPHPTSTPLAGAPHSTSLHPCTAVDSITPARFVTRTQLP